MVTDDHGNPGGSGAFQRGETPDERQERLPLDYRSGGSGHSISQRLDGWYTNWRGQQEPIHGWFYPDQNGDASLPQVDSQAA